MIKKLAILTFIIGVGIAVKASATDVPLIADSTGTVFAVSVGTNPAVLISTGSNIKFPPGQGGVWKSLELSTSGIYLENKKFTEVYNDTGQDIWLGYDSNISTTIGSSNATYGRRLPHGSSMSYQNRVNLWAVASTPTVRGIIITQER